MRLPASRIGRASDAYYREDYDPHFNAAHFAQYAAKRWRALRPFLESGLSPHDLVLDLGCGEGLFLEFLRARTGSEVVGVDYSMHCCRLARRRSGSSNAVIRADAAALPLPTDAFALVFSNALLHHVADVPSVVREAVRVAAPGGLVVFVEPNRIHPLQILHGLSRRAERGTLRFSVRVVENVLLKEPRAHGYWTRPINTYLYIRKRFPPPWLGPLFRTLEDALELPHVSTHNMILIRKR